MSDVHMQDQGGELRDRVTAIIDAAWDNAPNQGPSIARWREVITQALAAQPVVPEPLSHQQLYSQWLKVEGSSISFDAYHAQYLRQWIAALRPTAPEPRAPAVARFDEAKDWLVIVESLARGKHRYSSVKRTLSECRQRVKDLEIETANCSVGLIPNQALRPTREEPEPYFCYECVHGITHQHPLSASQLENRCGFPCVLGKGHAGRCVDSSQLMETREEPREPLQTALEKLADEVAAVPCIVALPANVVRAYYAVRNARAKSEEKP